MITHGSTSVLSLRGSRFSGTYFGKVGNDLGGLGSDSLNEVLTRAGLNFEAIAEPVRDIRGNTIPRAQNIVRADTGVSLGLNGAGYAVTQTRDAFKHLSSLPGDVRFVRGGMLKGGRFFLACEYGSFDASDDSADLVTAFGVHLSSFDGSWDNKSAYWLGRHGCMNICRFEGLTQTVGASAGRRAKHTLNHGIKLERFSFNLAMAQSEAVVSIGKLRAKAISRETLDRVISEVVPGDSGKSLNIRNRIADYFTDSRLGMHGNSVWDAFNAFSAYDTHAATRRATEIATAEENAFDALITGRGYADRALPLLLALN